LIQVWFSELLLNKILPTMLTYCLCFISVVFTSGNFENFVFKCFQMKQLSWSIYVACL
jgi:hypothetical protein